MLTIRRSEERGLAERSWLKSHHTFSFAEYYDPEHMGFGTLRVINEDWIKGGMGFGAHPHHNMEIITYVISGSLAHQDSLGNKAVIQPNEIQRMTAGSGIVHSEINPHSDQKTHLFQIWIKPEKKDLTPSYDQKSFAKQLDSEKMVLVVSSDGRNESVSINQDVDLYIARLKEQLTIEFEVHPQRQAWIQMVFGNITVNGQTIQIGDAMAITDEPKLTMSGGQGAEFLLFDLKI